MWTLISATSPLGGLARGSLSLREKTAVFTKYLHDRIDALRFLCNMLLEQPTIHGEIERRVAANLWHAGRGGRGGAAPSRPPDERAALNSQDPEDLNASICMLCEVPRSTLVCLQFARARKV